MRIGAIAVEQRRRDDGKSEQVYATAVGRVAICEGAGTNAVTRRPSTRPFAVSVVLAPTDRPRRRRKSS